MQRKTRCQGNRRNTRDVKKKCKEAAPKYKEMQRSARECNEAQEPTGHARSCKELENIAGECTIPDPSPNTPPPTPIPPRSLPDPSPIPPSARGNARARSPIPSPIHPRPLPDPSPIPPSARVRARTRARTHARGGWGWGAHARAPRALPCYPWGGLGGEGGG